MRALLPILVLLVGIGDLKSSNSFVKATRELHKSAVAYALDNDGALPGSLEEIPGIEGLIPDFIDRSNVFWLLPGGGNAWQLPPETPNVMIRYEWDGKEMWTMSLLNGRVRTFQAVTPYQRRSAMEWVVFWYEEHTYLFLSSLLNAALLLALWIAIYSKRRRGTTKSM